MKIYFENDPDKQEMLRIIKRYNYALCYNCDTVDRFPSKLLCKDKCGLMKETHVIIERITNKSIEEVLKS